MRLGNWCGVQVMLLAGQRLRFYGPARVFSDLPPHERNGLRDVDSNHEGEAYETSLVAKPSRDFRGEIEKWTVTALHRALPLAGRVTS